MEKGGTVGALVTARAGGRGSKGQSCGGIMKRRATTLAEFLGGRPCGPSGRGRRAILRGAAEHELGSGRRPSATCVGA